MSMKEQKEEIIEERMYSIVVGIMTDKMAGSRCNYRAYNLNQYIKADTYHVMYSYRTFKQLCKLNLTFSLVYACLKTPVSNSLARTLLPPGSAGHYYYLYYSPHTQQDRELQVANRSVVRSYIYVQINILTDNYH